VPNRRFRLDIAFASEKLAVEVDGYRHHGRSLVNFKKDRARQNLLTLHGWRILRFSAGMIRTDMAGCLSTIHQALEPTHE
jgi:very-short-patch-repair endonuclease